MHQHQCGRKFSGVPCIWTRQETTAGRNCRGQWQRKWVWTQLAWTAILAVPWADTHKHAFLSSVWPFLVDCDIGQHWPYWWMCYAFCGSRSLLRRNCIHVKSVRMMWLCLSILFKYVCDKAWEPLWSLLNMEAVLQSAVSRNVVC